MKKGNNFCIFFTHVIITLLSLLWAGNNAIHYFPRGFIMILFPAPLINSKVNNILFSTQNVNVARFVRIIEWDFFGLFFKHCATECMRLRRCNMRKNYRVVSSFFGSQMHYQHYCSHPHLLHFSFPRVWGLMSVHYSDVGRKEQQASPTAPCPVTDSFETNHIC